MMSNSDIRVVSYNCRGWKSGSPFVDSFLNKFDVNYQPWILILISVMLVLAV